LGPLLSILILFAIGPCLTNILARFVSTHPQVTKNATTGAPPPSA
jgi:hypothetical protein